MMPSITNHESRHRDGNVGKPLLGANDWANVPSDDDDDDETEGLLAAQSAYPSLSPTYNSVQDGTDDSIEVEIKNPAVDPVPTQNSIVTIFSMWNTMMGTSLLSMPWAIKQAGFVNGIILLIVVAGIMAYTSYRVLSSSRSSVATVVISDFSDAVRIYLGKISEAVALVCSLLALLGGAIVYWILMSNFLYHIVLFIYEKVNDDSPTNSTSGNISISIFNTASDHVVCHTGNESREGQSEIFKAVWSETFTVPLYLIVLLFPLFNFKSPTFFTKFNALGTISVMYLLIFTIVKASQWGVNLDFSSDHQDDPSHSTYFSWTFPALTGVAALAYFLHNAAMSIVRNQKHPENNTRDLIIAYVLVCFTYTFIGSIFYATFPLDKSCVADNLLNNLASEDVMAFVARVCLLFQMTCVLPLILFVFRAQLLHFFFGRIWPGRAHVLVLNAVIVTLCVLFAIFMPKIGHIISFVGAFCGFSYAIAFPCAVFLVMCYRQGTITWLKVMVHGFLIALGLINFLAQFIIMGHTS